MVDQESRASRQEVEQFSHAVRLLHAAREPLARAFRALTSSWVLFAATVSAVLVVLGWVIYGVSPLHTAQDIGHRQQQRSFQVRLVKQRIDLGNDFLTVGQLEAAKREFAAAIELDRFSTEAAFGLLKASVFEPIPAPHELGDNAGNYDPEITQLKLMKILDERPGDSHALAYLGQIYTRIDTASARAWYDSSLSRKRRNAAALYGRGVLYDMEGETDSAQSMYEAAYMVSPWNQTYANNLAYQYYLHGEYRRSDSLYRSLLNLDSRFLLSYAMLINTHLMLGGVRHSTLRSAEELFLDSTVVALPRNQGQWFFHVGDRNVVSLYSNVEKLAYAFYLMSAAEYTHGHFDEAGRYLTILGDLMVPLERLTGVQRILRRDLDVLRESRPHLTDLVDRFATLALGGTTKAR